jgi:hypothetical protein
MDDDFNNDAAVDAYHDGYDLFRKGNARPEEAHMAQGWDDAQRASRVRVVMPRRPEGYYHSPLGAFD